MDEYWRALKRLVKERHACGLDRVSRLRLLLRWDGVRVHHASRYARRRRRTRQQRRQVFGAVCWVCQGTVMATCVHHVIQVQHGGGNERENLVPLCAGCHAAVHPWMDGASHPMVREAAQMEAFRW